MWNKLKLKYYFWLIKHKQFDFFDHFVTPYPYKDSDIDVKRNDGEMFKSHFYVGDKKFVMVADKNISSCSIRVYPISDVSKDVVKGVIQGIIASINILNRSDYFDRYYFKMCEEHYKLMRRIFNKHFGYMECGMI